MEHYRDILEYILNVLGTKTNRRGEIGIVSRGMRQPSPCTNGQKGTEYPDLRGVCSHRSRSAMVQELLGVLS